MSEPVKPELVKIPMLRVPRTLAERWRNARYALSGPPCCYSLTDILIAGLDGEVSRLEAEFNRGRTFKARPDAELTDRELKAALAAARGEA